MPEALTFTLVTIAVLGLACWAGNLCPLPARRRERVIEICLVLLNLIQDLQRHRGLSCAILANRHDFRSEIDAIEYKLMRSLDAVGERYGEHHPLFRRERWRIVLGRWEALRNHWRSLTYETSIFAHGEVITGLTGILKSLAEEHRQLLGDSTVHCIAEWPRLIEDLGLLRAMGLHLLGQRPNDEEQLQVDKITNQLGTARARLRQIRDECADRNLTVRTERAIDRVSWLLDGNAGRYHPYTFYEDMTAVIDDWYGLMRSRLQEYAPKESATRRLMGSLHLQPRAGMGAGRR